MSISAIAAIAPAVGEPLIIDEIFVSHPGSDEVLVAMQASGLCHTDLSVIEGKFPFPLPAILGHEGAGIVLECGPSVADIQPGDHVILNNLPHCGHCRPCLSNKTGYCEELPRRSARPPAFTWKGEPLRSMGSVASFSSHTVIRSDQVTVIPRDVPFASAALVPCGVLTGIGAISSNAKVEEGSSVLVFGMGSIGLNAVQGARLAKAGRIIAIDTNPAKEAPARLFGATDFVNPAALVVSLEEHVKTLLGGFADYAFECVGNTKLVASALSLVSPYWGVCLAVGIAPFDQQITLPATSFYVGRSLRGTLIGDANPVTETPKIVSLYRAGELRLDELVTQRLKLRDINCGFELMKRGEALRVVVEF